MSTIILPPVPPRPKDAARPTMHPELKEPGNRGTEVVMIQGPGTEPGPQPEPPEPSEPLAVAENMGSNWLGSNVYEIGQTIEAKTAEYVGGVSPVNYRWRFQFKPEGSDKWESQPWTTCENIKTSCTYFIGIPQQVKLQTQARDSSDPVVQLNSQTGIKTVPVPAPLAVSDPTVTVSN